MSSPFRSNRSRLDRVIIFTCAVFAFTSLVMEMYIVFDIDLPTANDTLGQLWFYYAEQWDPIFLDPPLYLRIMCAVDAFLFGPFYLVMIYAFLRGRNWIRLPAFLYVGAIVYSTIIYFLVELIGEGGRADLLMVIVVNIPYTIMPLLIAWRLRHREPFPSPAPAMAAA